MCVTESLPRRNACQEFQKFTVTLVGFCLTRGMLQSLASTLITANYSPSWRAFSLRQHTANWCCTLNQHHPSVKGMPSRASLCTWHFLWRSPCSKRESFQPEEEHPECCWQENPHWQLRGAATTTQTDITTLFLPFTNQGYHETLAQEIRWRKEHCILL